MILIVTGTPGTGKTTVAKEVSKLLNHEYIDVNELIRTKEYDQERDCRIVDVEELKTKLLSLINKSSDLVIDSHLSHYLDSKFVDLCIVTKCSLPVLKKRLEKRNYSEKKIRENLDAEIFDTCRVEAQEQGHKIVTINTDQKYDLKKILHAAGVAAP